MRAFFSLARASSGVQSILTVIFMAVSPSMGLAL